MAKINVTLRCQIDNGKEVKQPGEVVSMDEVQAQSLAAMGMVILPGEEPEAAATKPPKKQGKKTPPTVTGNEGGDTDPDKVGEDDEGE